jgi:thioredoxin
MNLTDENFEKEINATDKFVLVDFFAVWCGPCSVLGPILEKIAEQFKDKVVLMKANTDDVPVNAQKFGIDKIPAVYLFKNGKQINNFVGLIPEPAIKEWLENIINSMEKDNSPTTTVKTQETPEELIKRCNDYAEKNGLHLNPDKKTVERIVKGLLGNETKYGEQYCPCRRVSGRPDNGYPEEDAKKICPCFWHKEEIEKDGHCFCNLFVR